MNDQMSQTVTKGRKLALLFLKSLRFSYTEDLHRKTAERKIHYLGFNPQGIVHNK